MACEQEQQAVDDLNDTLQALHESLGQATPAEKPSIINEIKAAMNALGKARAKLAVCEAAHEKKQQIDVNASVLARYSGPLVGEKSDHASFDLRMTLIGSNDQRAVTMDHFTISRAAEVDIVPQRGDFVVSTGAMSLPGLVTVKYAGQEAQDVVTLTTGNASSPSGKYSGTGSPFDTNTLTMALVAGGGVAVTVFGQVLLYEFFVTVACNFGSTPQ